MKNLLAQIGLVLALGFIIGVGLTVFAIGAAPIGDVSISVSPRTIATTLVGIAVLSVIGGIGAIRRVLGIDPIEATEPGGQGT